MTAPPIRVLVIEDNPGDFALLQEYLTEEGEKPFLLEWVDRLAAGLACLDRGGVDVVLLDLGLPDSQGLDTLGRLTRHAPTIPVVILTGLEEDGLGLEAVRSGAQDYVIKGQITGRGIKRALRYSVERFRAREQLQQQAAQLQLLTEQLPAILWTTDRELRFTSAVGAGLRQLNLEPGQVVGMKLQEYLQASDPDFQPLDVHYRALQGEKVAYDHDWKGRTFQTRVEPLHQGEHIVGVIGVALDVTDSKNVQEEFRIARTIQQGLLPKSAPSVLHFDIGGSSYPAQATGGDFFDFISLADRSIGLAIGDAIGHGFGPALLAAVVHASLNALALADPRVCIGTMVATCNRLLCQGAGEERIVTLLVARLDPQTRTLTYCNAGHPAGLLVDASGNVRTRLGSTGFLLGLMPDEAYAPAPAVVLQPGEVVVFVTDGILEAECADGTPFGVTRALEVVHHCRDRRAQEIADALCRAARDACPGIVQQDDITAAVIKVGDGS